MKPCFQRTAGRERTLLRIGAAIAIASVPLAVSADPTLAPAQAPTLFVSPAGTDESGAGSQARPFRTISAALRSNPAPGTIVQLAPGTYSASETFPLMLPPGVRLQGTPAALGQGVLISGGGRFVSPTFGSQNVAIVAASGTQVAGITLTNSNPRGYGLWVESGQNVSIVNNTFANSTHDGIFLTGSASVSIAGNRFAGNRGSGISAVGSSAGEIRNNTFTDTGFGLSIGQRSRVLVADNEIANNVDGIIVTHIATPKLRGNRLANNRRNGLVVLKDRNGSPIPDLGTTSDPGRNRFEGNGDKDIANAAGVPLAAAGNTFNPLRVSGAIDTNATGVASAPANAPVVIPPPSVSRPPATPPAKPVTPSGPIPREIPIARAPQSKPSSPSPTASPTASSIPASPAPTALPPASAPKTASTPAGLRYRVAIPLTSKTTKEAVKQLVPDAFTSTYNGKPAMQAGVFRDRAQAELRIRELNAAGITAAIEIVR